MDICFMLNRRIFLETNINFDFEKKYQKENFNYLWLKYQYLAVDLYVAPNI